MGTLAGKVAIITGCGRLKGIGRATALALAAEGAAVAVTDVAAGGTRNRNDAGEAEAKAGWRGLESLVDEITQSGGRALAVIGDVGLKAEAQRMVGEAIDHFGQVDILVNNAGAPQGEDRNFIWEVPEDAFDLVIQTNIKGVYLMSVAVIHHLLNRAAPGRLINISSGAGKRGFPKSATYSASKFAVVGFTQALAQELGPHNITVNAVCPGHIETARVAGAVSKNAVQRMGTAADIARAVAFLADPASDFISGQSLNVDGGFIMG